MSQKEQSLARVTQRGAALIISMILLVIMTLLGLAAIRNITQEERMATFSYDRSLSFQATEAALREVEQLVATNKPVPTAAGCSVMGSIMVCMTPAATATPRWLDSTFTSWTSASSVGVGSLAMAPEYFVEYLGNTFDCRPGDSGNLAECKRYRITARSPDAAGNRASVMLQSVYATD